MKTFFILLGIGILGGFIAAHIYVQGFFISWIKLSKPPEEPQKILSVNKGIWIKTESDNIYYYPSSEMYPFRPIACEKNCWHKYEIAPASEEYISNSSGCGMYSPSTKWLIDSISVCQNFGPAAIAFAYGFDKNGIVHYWLHPIGDQNGLAYIVFPVQGGAYGLILGLAWLVISIIYDAIKERKSGINYDDLPDN
ncbi:MAG: hypothetical protein JNJ43_09485 [Anaerolineales bacterium]|nr:hypothetical protein [Anaerolineales bacterium]